LCENRGSGYRGPAFAPRRAATGAAAPLLDAVKDRKTGDAVRPVIERFTGGGDRRLQGSGGWDREA
jgi:hypothetical protein